MKSFISIACMALCVAVASAQYQASGYQQRKMSPMPAYGQSSAGYNAPAAANEYESSSSGYGSNKRAPSSAMTSQYDERTPAAASGYGASASSGYNSRPTNSYQQSKGASYGASAGPAVASYGQTNSYSAKPKYEEPYHPPMPFAWGYDINDGYGGAQYHKENGDEYGKRTGSYGYTDAYGVYRQVDYVADEYGFRATVKTNEPGTANEEPASTKWTSYDPPSTFYAGNTNSYSSGSGSSYGSAAGPESYGSGSSSSGYASSPKRAQQPSYARPQQQSYSAANSGYPQQQRAYSDQPQQYEQQQQQQQQMYASSVRVPVYAKASAPAFVARKY